MKANTVTNGNNRRRATGTAVVLATALCWATPGAQAEERGAKAMLKAMADYVGSQQAIELTFDSDIEVITPELELSLIHIPSPRDGLLSRMPSSA